VITMLLMLILMVVFAIVILWGTSYDSKKESIMSMADNTFLRGFWSIIVVLVHVPQMYQNRIQDMVGSFAYVGVTFFFLASSFGLKRSITNKPDYISHFWRRRLPSILMPALLANALCNVSYCLLGKELNWKAFININPWVKVLLIYYFIFWLFYAILPKAFGTGWWQDVLIILIVCGISLGGYFTPIKISKIWIVEPVGFAYGILVANYAKQIIVWIRKKWFINSLCLMILSLICGVAYLWFKPVVFYGDYFLKLVLGIMITAFIFTLLGKLRVGNKVNFFLGTISYEVYLLHSDIFNIIRFIFETKPIDSGLYIIISLTLTIICSAILWWITKLVNTNLIRVLSRWKCLKLKRERSNIT